jgi:hypothetical protein
LHKLWLCNESPLSELWWRAGHSTASIGLVIRI